jgi:LuxR family quorum sensing-dependent transcriptional regulator
LSAGCSVAAEWLEGIMPSTAESYWGKRSLDFVDAVRNAKQAVDVVALFETTILELGFHAYIMADVPTRGQSLEQLTVANGWPAEWFELYSRGNFSNSDPIPRHCFSTVNPFEWKDAPFDRQKDVEARIVMDRAADFRLFSGFCIPIHYEDSTGAISMAGERPELSPETKKALHLISVFAYGRLCSLRRPVQARPSQLLNDKEVAVLTWAARGKTSWETGQVMALPERTVKWLLTEAQRKLNTSNKTATVAQALVKKEIHI